MLQHNFSVIRSAGNSTYNFVNPVRRDVVSIGESGDNVTIRFQTDNEGPWIMHWFVISAPTYIPIINLLILDTQSYQLALEFVRAYHPY